MKKETWKLIELLNEYEIEREEKIDLFNDKEKPLWEWYKDCTGDLTFEPIDSKILNWEAFSWDTANSVIISKSYGFIWWLVDNEKIDKSKVFSFIDTADKPYEDIICLLALSDEPISDLISYLR